MGRSKVYKMTAPTEKNSGATTAGAEFPISDQRIRGSHMSPAALAAARRSDDIEIAGRWRPAMTLIVVVAGSAGLWAAISMAIRAFSR
jgi:hypothetical protein